MFSSILFLLAQTPAASPEPPAEPPAVVAQRAAAEALEARGIFTDAGHAYVKLAEMPGVNRRSELDKAHTNYDSAYLATKDSSHLCWALRIAEQVVDEGEFIDADQQSYWRDTLDDDLRRLQDDARTNQRANCRFNETGAPRVLVATLNDEDFAAQAPTASREDERRPLPKVTTTRRWRAHTASGAVLTGIGLGLVGALAGVLESQAQHARAMRRMTSMANAEGRDFTADEWQEFNAIRDEGRQVRGAAIGVGVAGAITLSTGVALLATRKRASRKFAVQPHGGPLGGGVVLRLRF
jgi:hypothetical protein